MVELQRDRVERWLAGENIQFVWPEMTPAERERLISGTCDPCWEELCG